MSSTAFESLTCALLDKEPGVGRADLYGTPRQKQFGVDAFGETVTGLIVASCKCYGKVKKGDLKTWSDDFLSHLDSHWRPRNVRKFILAVAAPMNSAQRLADIDAERARFKAVGLEYDCWAPRQLQELLREQPGIVSQHLGAEWEPRICGRINGTIQPPSQTATASMDDLQAQIEALKQAVSGGVEQQIDAAALELENGAAAEIEAVIAGIRSVPTWPNLSPRAQARTLRLEASLLINRGDLDGAEALSLQADAIQPQEEPRLRALIAMNRQGPDEALAILGAPTTTQGRTLRIGLLLNSGNLADAETDLSAMPADDAESLRLRAHLQLMRGDAAGAFASASAAEAHAPGRAAVRRVGAIARYAVALSASAPAESMSFPQPVPRNLVRQDDESQGHLQAAYDVFHQLAQAAGPEFGQADRVWALACLCNSVGRTAEAATLCGEILDGAPASPIAIGWALARGLDFDRTRTLAAVRAEIESGAADLNVLRAFEWLAQDLEPADAEAWLRGLRVDHMAADFAAEMSAVAERIAARRTGLEPGEPTVAALDAAHRSGDWSAVETELAQLAAQDPPPPILLAVADELAGAGRWPALQPHIKLIASFATADSIRVAAFVAYNTGAAQTAVDLLGQNLSAFAGGRLPFDLRRLEARALVQAGDLPEALRRAAALAGESGSISDQILQAEVKFAIGDLAGAAPALRAALNEGAMPAPDALRWSGRFVGEDPDLARTLWRAATANDLSDELLLGAVDLAFRLNLARERPDLMASFQRLASERPDLVQTPTLDEVVSMMRQRMEVAGEIEAAWTRGELPVHLAFSSLRGNLADAYFLEQPLRSRRRPMFIRHGGRGDHFEVGLPFQSWRLSLDMTGLLLAEQLGVLALADELNIPIRVSPAMPAALMILEERSRPHQPERIVATRTVAAALAAGRINVGGGPAGAITIVHEPAEGQGIGLNAFPAALRRIGGVDPGLLDRAQAALGGAGADEASLDAGVSLSCQMGVLNELAGAGLLDAVLARFNVWIEVATAQNLRGEIESADRGEALANWLARVRRLVRDRIESGRYGVLPSAQVQAVNEPDESATIEDPVVQTLLDAIKGADIPGEILWVDDRHLSGYPRAGQAIIVGAFDVLDQLNLDGLLSDQLYYDALRRLREAGALFLPVTLAEVLHHLRAAAVVNGDVVESPGLTGIRRNVALALIHEGSLKTLEQPGPLEGRPNEFPFILGLRRLAETSIVAVWSDGAGVSAARARSDWLWSALRAEHLRGNDGPAFDPRLFPALNIAGLAASSIQIVPNGPETPGETRKAFSAWLEEEVVGSRLRLDPSLADEAVRMTAMLIQSSARPEGREPRDPQYAAAMQRLLRLGIALLPESLRDRVAGDPDVRRAVRLTNALAIQIRGSALDVNRFWKAVRTALCYGEARLRDTSGKRVRVKRVSSEAVRLSGAVRTTLADPALGVLAAEAGVRQLAVESLLDEVDTPAAKRPAARARLANAVTPAERMKVVEELRSSSILTFGRRLTEALNRNQTIAMALFDPPLATAWLDYLRWPTDPGADAVAEAANTLSEDLDGWTAFDRLAALPVRLPGHVYEAAAGAPQRAEFPAGYVRTPMFGFHRLHVEARDLAFDDQQLGEAVDAMLADYRGPASLFTILLRWAERRFGQQTGWGDVAPMARVAIVWTYADCVTDILCSLPLNFVATAELLRDRLPPRRLREKLTLLTGLDDSVYDPEAIHAEPLLMAGLEFCLGKRFAGLEPTEARSEAFTAYFGARLEDGSTVSRPMRAMEDIANPYPTWLSRSPADHGPFGSTLLGDSFVVSAVEALASDPTDINSWLYLVAWGPPSLPESATEALRAVLADFDLGAFVDTRGVPLVRAVAEVAARLAGEEACSGLLEKFLAFADWQSQRDRAAGQSNSGWLSSLLEAGATASRSYEPGRGMQRFSQFAIGLMSLAPDTASTLLRAFDAAVDQIPTAASLELWRALLVARAT
ncbi:hypothetical protein [Phenylobacterium sp.]|uniref:HTH domain-containing protein n=1 Tax=Phenylobacterium sp. TaxID=1871053 RepID=UPI00121830AF|nr:hypothetical protein [Phenylobacterium sp.]THD64450.1 MAG: hypothetical protein E8A49_02945 [Phenylobacterium sp.]